MIQRIRGVENKENNPVALYLAQASRRMVKVNKNRVDAIIMVLDLK